MPQSARFQHPVGGRGAGSPAVCDGGVSKTPVASISDLSSNNDEFYKEEMKPIGAGMLEIKKSRNDGKSTHDSWNAGNNKKNN